MRVVRVLAPGADAALAASVEAAVRAFNASLDIRLRFLSIGIEERVLRPEDAASAAEQVGAALAGEGGAPGADAVLLLGEGEAAVAAAATAVRARVPLVRVGAGCRDGRCAETARGIDRIAATLLVHGAEAAAVLRAEGIPTETVDVGPPGDAAAGDRIVRALSRARRRGPC